MDWVTKYWIEWIFGILAAALIWLYKRLTQRIKEERAEQEALKAGLIALLRAQMVSDFEKYSDRGSASVYARESYENVYRQYKNLGGNGVMTDLHNKFMQLPIE